MIGEGCCALLLPLTLLVLLSCNVCYFYTAE